MAANDLIARENRRIFDRHGVFVVNLMSSPGAGKTTLLGRTLAVLKDEFAIAVIEGDIRGQHVYYMANRCCLDACTRWLVEQLTGRDHKSCDKL